MGDKYIARPEEFDTLERITADSERFFVVRQRESLCMPSLFHHNKGTFFHHVQLQ